ncbi:EG45-like domain containing protein [Mercurialis annua]|uniref:EG45-like domain containing protein n=1 Tax=Mercurialis annua TaxID=3986 RepID=UPI00215EF4EA|nr:EG45-like domain containing protein [Mercurialis annua]
MANKIQQRSSYIFLLLLATFFPLAYGDVGTAAHYSPPYVPSACNGEDLGQFPANNLFAAAGDGIWNNGASCGREYIVRCISADVPSTCFPDKIITVKIVDYAESSVSKPSSSGATIVLSEAAFRQIGQLSASQVNVEFQLN